MGHRAIHPLLILAVVVLTGFFVMNLVATSFERLGLPRPLVTLLLIGSIGGSLVNIPVWRHATETAGTYVILGPLVFYRPPVLDHQIVAVNVGGALVPLALSAWLLPHAALWKVTVAVLVVAFTTHRMARVEPNVGIVLPALVPPVLAGLLGWLLASGGAEAAPIAYICGTLGTLFGADLLNLNRLDEIGPGVMSIGGAGVFDGVFMVGIIAALLA